MARTFEEIAQDLELCERELSEQAAHLEEQLRYVHRALSRARNARKALVDSPKPQPARAKRSNRRVRPTEKNLKAIVSAIDAAPRGLTRQEIAEATGLSIDTVQRGITALREDEVIRAAGNVPGLKTTMFMLMPGGGMNGND